MTKHEPPEGAEFGVISIPSTDDPVAVVHCLLKAFASELAALVAVEMCLKEEPEEHRRCPRCNDGMPTCGAFNMVPQNLAHKIACEPFELSERLCDDCSRIVNAPFN